MFSIKLPNCNLKWNKKKPENYFEETEYVILNANRIVTPSTETDYNTFNQECLKVNISISNKEIMQPSAKWLAVSVHFHLSKAVYFWYFYEAIVILGISCRFTYKRKLILFLIKSTVSILLGLTIMFTFFQHVFNISQ